MAKMPAQKPGKSKQDYQTPKPFLGALKRRLGISDFYIDLAASPDNTVAQFFYTEDQDSLSANCPWETPEGTWAFCNPPFGKIAPWVEKALAAVWDHKSQIAMLVPTAVGANWWYDYVDSRANVLFLNGRLGFIAEKPKMLYPKDLAILLYTPAIFGGYEVWHWKDDL